LSAGTPPPTADRPDYNEYPMWSPKSSSRGGRTVDLFLLHTEEGDHNADSLARWLDNTPMEVSYHYTISEDYNDHGVTVVDVVNTDDASWSVLSANSRSINLCFAGSRAGWSRDQWLKQSRAIDVAAYLAVQDCKHYGISTRVVPPPYNSTPGISDHQYVTKVLKDGSHTDVGPNFPWDVFAASVAKYSNQTPAPAPAPARQFPKDFTDHELLEWIVAQLGPGDPAWQSKGMTLRDKVWSLDSDAS
jgi:N-acetyl-anhydromuramyl-L-alanine amidase AmpD